MTDYRRKPTAVQAWQFTGQPQVEWPEWVSEHRVATNMGLQPIGLGAGVVLLPTKGGTTTNVVAGQTLVLEDGVVAAYKPEKFEQFFEAVDAPAAEVAPAPVAEPTPAPEPATAKKKDEPAPVVEEPAAPAAAEEPVPEA